MMVQDGLPAKSPTLYNTPNTVAGTTLAGSVILTTNSLTKVL